MANRSLLLFLYSTPNIIGTIWGLIGLVAFFVIKDIRWLYFVPVLYTCGYFVAPKTTVLSNQAMGGLSGRDLQEMLESLIKKISKRVAQPELNKVIHIKNNILMLLPRLNELNAGDYDLHVVKQTVTDYLPQMLTTYLELPPAFATMHKMRNGKTSQAILIEQLTILNDQIEQIIVSVNSKDADALIAQGEFLKSKFANDGDWL
ncbi:MAG: hypothetical protein Q8N30_00875 [Methylococcales bacterium]|nr:hypothetical protein [Methylococcales bacterium]